MKGVVAGAAREMAIGMEMRVMIVMVRKMRMETMSLARVGGSFERGRPYR
jgi:hypothetical protein